jgi:Galactose oxidase, central domain
MARAQPQAVYACRRCRRKVGEQVNIFWEFDSGSDPNSFSLVLLFEIRRNRIMSTRQTRTCILSLIVFLLTILMPAVATAAGKPVSAKINLKKLASGKLISISQARKPMKTFASVHYIASIDNFVTWGKGGGWRWDAPHGKQSFRYDVEILRVGAESPQWSDYLPKGKEKTWANGKFPDWSCRCHRVNGTLNRPWRKDIHDHFVGGHLKINRISFNDTDGIIRPTRASVFHQSCVDTKRNKIFYFVGGKTFTYDPVNRLWEDLKTRHPVTCETLVWASLVYDPIGDQIILFGGGMALNPWGGAKTWVYDFKKHLWSRAPLKSSIEPPLRCNARMIYDEKTKTIVLFGGDAQSKTLADTWVLNPASMEWEKKNPITAPPPASRYAATYIKKHGLILYIFPASKQGGKYIWTYNASQNKWVPRIGSFTRGNSTAWLSCDYSSKDDVVLLNLWKVGTYLYRLDPNSIDKDPKRSKAPASRFRWAYPKQVESLLAAPPPDLNKISEKLKNLPGNTIVAANYPGFLRNKDWSGATIDTDQGVVIYQGGGHSGYSGNDFAAYAVAQNRWSCLWPPHFMPFLGGCSIRSYGWSYGMRPQSRHTYQAYTYDPLSKTVIYCTDLVPSMQGKEIILDKKTKDVIIYNTKTHGPITWVYDCQRKKLFPPVLGRSFSPQYVRQIYTIGTPEGVFARTPKYLYHGKITTSEEKAEVKWTKLDKVPGKIHRGGGEFHPLVYDSKRKRLLTMGFAGSIYGYSHPVGKGKWSDMGCKGGKSFARDVVYDAVNDCLITMPEEKLLIMDCKTNIWKELDIKMPKAKGGYGVGCALLYDPVHQVCIIMLNEIKKGRRMGVYYLRYNPETAKYK